jgi:hypothetical protein
MKSQASEALNPESLQSQNRLRQKFESPIKPLGVLHGRQDNQGAVECATAEAAVRLAEAMAHTHGYVAAIAFAGTGSPATGQYGPAEVLKSVGGGKP